MHLRRLFPPLAAAALLAAALPAAAQAGQVRTGPEPPDVAALRQAGVPVAARTASARRRTPSSIWSAVTPE